MRKKNIVVYPVILLSMVLWSFSFIWYKKVFVFYKPITVVFFRLVLSSLFMFAINRLLGKQQRIQPVDFKNIFLLSLFQPFLYFICESYGMQLVSPTIGAVIISTIPLFSPFVAHYMFDEKLSILNITGIILSFIGILIIILSKNFKFTASPTGIFLLMTAVAAAIGYSAMVIKLGKKYNSFSIIATQNTIGIFLFLPLFLIFDYNTFIKVPFNWSAIKYLIYLAVFASSLAFVFFTYSIKILGITKANMFSNAIPIFTAIFSFFILHEALSTKVLVGIAIVLSGLFLSQIDYYKLKDKHKYFFKKLS